MEVHYSEAAEGLSRGFWVYLLFSFPAKMGKISRA